MVIDADPTRIALTEALGYPVVAGDAAEEAVLSAANITAAAVLAVVLPDEAANVFITLSARELNGSIEIISRGERPETERKLLRAGANRVVLPTAAGASRIARMITNPSAESLLRDGAGMAQLDEQPRHIGLQFVEIPIPADSTLVNTMIDDIDRAIWQRSSLLQSGRPPAKSVAPHTEQACSHRTTRSSLSAAGVTSRSHSTRPQKPV